MLLLPAKDLFLRADIKDGLLVAAEAAEDLHRREQSKQMPKCRSTCAMVKTPRRRFCRDHIGSS